MASLPLHRKQLYQEFVANLYICVESSRLRYTFSNQRQLKVEIYQGITEMLEAGGHIDGKNIILPSTFIGGPWSMLQLYQDAMALEKLYRKPSLFITMTANPRWPEKKDCLIGNRVASNCPDIISRVFKMKLDTLILYLTINKQLGKVKSYFYTIKYQKRGLPHTHIILILAKDSIPNESSQIDTLVCAEIPHLYQEKKLFELVTTTMLHSPCKEGS
ncbi:hypothetical protein O181_046790 [Austropuccinia psidii MF-1]|uniref:Helitron helicase-like domain-containing protein n=1 Tax=Austropuccinia psidii MF-1 TaxID=1389203 RepID=A0A9Q3DP57_9BASI|nr:hypothetical protein [Austropuccinia psidii MF-1]